MIKDKFIRGSSFLFIAMMGGNIFAYLFQLSMGRLLPVEEYGEMNALMSLMVIFGIPFATLINYFGREASIFFAKGDYCSIRGLHRFGMSKLCRILIPVLSISGLMSPFIGNYLGVSFDKILLVFSCIFFASLVTINTGIIQGMQSFKSLSFIGAGTPFFKLVFAVIFVWCGFGVDGALGGLLATNLVIWYYSQRFINASIPRQNNFFTIPFKDIYKYIGGFLLANLFFGLMTQADVVIVKHYFAPQEAGLYASAAIMGKSVLYIPSAIVMAMFPMVAANQVSGHPSTNMLIKAIGLTLALSGTGALILFYFSDFILEILFGTRYIMAASITKMFGLAMLPMAVTQLLMNFLLAQGNIKFVVFMAIAAILELLGFHFFRSDLLSVLLVIMITGMIALLPIVFSMGWQYKKIKYAN